MTRFSTKIEGDYFYDWVETCCQILRSRHPQGEFGEDGGRDFFYREYKNESDLEPPEMAVDWYENQHSII